MTVWNTSQIPWSSETFYETLSERFAIVQESSELIYWEKSRRVVCWKRHFLKHVSNYRKNLERSFGTWFLR